MSAHIAVHHPGKPRIRKVKPAPACHLAFDLHDSDGHIDGLTVVHFDSTDDLTEWLASACEGLSALLEPDPCGGGSLPDHHGEVQA